ncbi:MAG: outer membrane beta-barrel protein [Candidatus Methylomirabilales bacterium]
MKGMIRSFWMIGISLMTFVAVGPAFGGEGVLASRTVGTDRAEVQALRRELEAANAALDEMKRLYDAKIKALQERLTRVERAEPTTAAPLSPAETQPEQPKAGKGEKEIRLGEIPERQGPLPGLPEIAGTRITGFVVGSANFATTQRFPGTTPASGVIPKFKREVEAPTDPDELNFRFNSFNIGFTRRLADWLLASAAIEVENDRAIEAFEMETDLERESKTEVEIDVFELTAIAPIGNGLAFSFGKFNVPFGIEREDPPFNLQATNSLVFELGRPSKVLGFRTAYQFNPSLDVQLFAVNGWDVDEDNNGGKTFGGRLGFTPVEGFHLGVGGFWGPEQDDRSSPKRRIIDADAIFTDIPRLTLAAEFVYGTEGDVGVFSVKEPRLLVGLEAADVAALVRQKDADWLGVALTGHYDLSDLWGLTLRYGYFNDIDGGRTAFDQVLHSFTLAPVIHLSNPIPGLGTVGTVPRSEHLIPHVDLRLEYRADWSDRDIFFTRENLAAFDDINHRFTLQLIGMF